MVNTHFNVEESWILELLLQEKQLHLRATEKIIFTLIVPERFDTMGRGESW